MYHSLYCKSSKRITQGLRVKGSWRPNITAIYWPLLLWPSALCLSRSPDAQPEARGLSRKKTSTRNGFLYHILSPTGLRNYWGPRGPLRPRVAFPTTSYSNFCGPQLNLVLTELYNSSTSTQSPTQSLEWHVWLSSSGNNCHAVQRLLSSGVSVYECTMGFFYLVPFRQSSTPTRFPLITAIGMCHFLPVHHLGMASLAGSKVKIQQKIKEISTKGKTIQTKQDIPKQRKEILSTIGRKWPKNIPTTGCKRNRAILG